MKNELSKCYLALLRKQVEEEIQFLVTNGHDHTFVTTPCMFCNPHHSGDKYHCRRLRELRQLQSKIMYHKRETASKLGRVPIGYESEAQAPMKNQIQYESALSHNDLPLLSSQF